MLYTMFPSLERVVLNSSRVPMHVKQKYWRQSLLPVRDYPKITQAPLIASDMV